jgi:predicted transcriptional regulator
MNETEVTALRNEIKKQIDVADERLLRLVFGMLEADSEKDWWDELPEEVQASIDQGIKDIEEGRFITHDEFMKRNEQWFKK